MVDKQLHRWEISPMKDSKRLFISFPNLSLHWWVLYSGSLRPLEFWEL